MKRDAPSYPLGALNRRFSATHDFNRCIPPTGIWPYSISKRRRYTGCCLVRLDESARTGRVVARGTAEEDHRNEHSDEPPHSSDSIRTAGTVQPRCRNPTRRNRTRRAITVGLRSAKNGPNQTIGFG